MSTTPAYIVPAAPDWILPCWHQGTWHSSAIRHRAYCTLLLASTERVLVLPIAWISKSPTTTVRVNETYIQQLCGLTDWFGGLVPFRSRSTFVSWDDQVSISMKDARIRKYKASKCLNEEEVENNWKQKQVRTHGQFCKQLNSVYTIYEYVLLFNLLICVTPTSYWSK